MMRLKLKIDVRGNVDQAGLERLRTHLKLNKEGRLTDDWDEAFGKRQVQCPDGVDVRISLYRDADDHNWTVNVSATEPGPDGVYLEALKTELVEGIVAAGYTGHIRANPTYGRNQ